MICSLQRRRRSLIDAGGGSRLESSLSIRPEAAFFAIALRSCNFSACRTKENLMGAKPLASSFSPSNHKHVKTLDGPPRLLSL